MYRIAMCEVGENGAVGAYHQIMRFLINGVMFWFRADAAKKKLRALQKECNMIRSRDRAFLAKLKRMDLECQQMRAKLSKVEYNETPAYGKRRPEKWCGS